MHLVLHNLIRRRSRSPRLQIPVMVSRRVRVIVGSTRDFASKFLEGLALGLWDESSGEDTAQHEEGEDLKDVVEPRAFGGAGRGTLLTEGTEDALGDDGADLAGGGGEAVGGGAVAGWEALAGNDEGGGVGAEVEEELSEDKEGEKASGVALEVVVSEAENDEDDGEEGEAHELNGLATDGVDESDGDPVAWDGAGADDDEVADGGVVEDFVDGVAAGVADGSQDDAVVERDTVEGDIEEEPGAHCADENLAVLPLGVVSPEVGPAGLGGLETAAGVGDDNSANGLIRVSLGLSSKISLGVLISLDDVASNVESVTGSLGNRKTEVESNAAGDSTETNDDTPHLVNSQTTNTTAVTDGRGSHQRLFEASSNNEGHDTSSKLANALHSKDRTHHSSTPLGSSEFRCDDRRTIRTH